MSTEFKPARWYGTDLPTEGFEKVFGLEGGPQLARPAAPAFSLDQGNDDGEITITVTAEPASWGDVLTPGDALGTEGPLQWWNPIDGWQELVNPSATGAFDKILDVSLWGMEVPIKVRGVSNSGLIGANSTELVLVLGTAPALRNLVMPLGGSVLYDTIPMVVLVAA